MLLCNHVFAQCLTSEHIFNVLDIPPSQGLNQSQFEQASTIIVSFMVALETHCVPSASWNWNRTTYPDFTMAQMNYSCSTLDPDHCITSIFSQYQLETAMTALNATYRPGNQVVLLNGTTVDDENRHNVSVVCSNPHWPVRTSI